MNKYLPAYLYLKRYSNQIIFVVLVSLVSGVFEGFSITMLIPLFQNIISGGAEASSGFPLLSRFNFLFEGMDQKKILVTILIFIFAMMVLKNLFTYAAYIMASRLKYRAIGNLRESLVEKILYCSNKYYDSVKSGHLVSSIYYETVRMGTFLSTLLNLLTVAVKVLVYVAILAMVSWKFSIVVAVLMLFVFPFIQHIIRKVKILGDIGSKASSKFNFIVLEVLTGIRVIKSFGAENYEKERFKKADSEFIDANYKYEKYNFLIAPLTETLMLTVFIVIFFIAVRTVNINFTSMIPYALVYVVLLNRTIQQLNMVNTYRGQMANNLAAFYTYKEVEDDIEKFSMKNGDKAMEAFKNSIEFKDVNFAYSENQYVLKDINLIIPKGRTTAVVGATGAGKSTLVNLIPRFYDATSGSIVIDGMPLKEFDIYSWRKKIGFVSQDVFIFNATVKDNIRYGNFSVSDEEVVKAAEAANAHEFISDMPDGYDTVVGERGVRLSGGQKQRISIARALINNPEILILDEATSAMDTKTEKLIQEAVENLSRGRTVVAIAHRLSTIEKADNIVVLDKGRLIESGTHEELLGKKGYYSSFYQVQYGRV
ncbi:MAG: ABC transporter ATP-binding protein [Armatimonadota bacterium]